MTIVSRSPWSGLNQLQDEMNRLFRSAGLNEGENSDVCTSEWCPAVDIKEEADRFVLYADLPGVDPRDIEVTMEKGVLTIRGERPPATPEERESFSRLERARGAFYRRFSLPDSTDSEKISARGSNGVLEVVIPKRAKLEPRRITVAG